MGSIEVAIDSRTKAVLEELKFRFGYEPEAVLSRAVQYVSGLYLSNPLRGSMMIKMIMKGGGK